MNKPGARTGSPAKDKGELKMERNRSETAQFDKQTKKIVGTQNEKVNELQSRSAGKALFSEINKELQSLARGMLCFALQAYDISITII
jgi:hypothetical protein